MKNEEWEHVVVSVYEPDQEAYLGRYGTEGWELVSAIPHAQLEDYVRLYFKRRRWTED